MARIQERLDNGASAIEIAAEAFRHAKANAALWVRLGEHFVKDDAHHKLIVELKSTQEVVRDLLALLKKRHVRLTARLEVTVDFLKSRLDCETDTLSKMLQQYPGVVLHGYSFGFWYCCQCKHKNDVYVNSGPQPLGRMSCAECLHIFDSRCKHSSFIDVWNGSPKYPRQTPQSCPELSITRFVPAFPVAHVCKNCGLSWRAKVDNVCMTLTNMNIEIVDWHTVENLYVCSSTFAL